MTIKIYLPAEIDASTSFLAALKQFIRRTFYEVTGEKPRSLVCYLPTTVYYQHDLERGISSMGEFSICFSGAYCLNLTLLWTHATDTRVVLPSEMIGKHEIRFWQEGLGDSISFVKEVLGSHRAYKRAHQADFTFSFSVQEEDWDGVDCTLTVTLPAENREKLVEVIGQGMEVWNSTEEENQKEGFLHYLGEMTINRSGSVSMHLNAGSASRQGLLFLLERLNQADLGIKKVLIDS